MNNFAGFSSAVNKLAATPQDLSTPVCQHACMVKNKDAKQTFETGTQPIFWWDLISHNKFKYPHPILKRIGDRNNCNSRLNFTNKVNFVQWNETIRFQFFHYRPSHKNECAVLLSQFSTVYTHKAHSPRNLRRLLLGTRTGYRQW